MRVSRALGLSAIVVTAGVLAPSAAAAQEPVGGARLATKGTVTVGGAAALPSGITAAGWLVADLDTGDVLAAHDPHGTYLPASTLKILTALTELPRLDLQRLVAPTAEDVAVDGNKALDPALSYPVRDLFGYLLLRSANDAANTIARVDGGRTNTLARMAAEARHLRAEDTNPLTPSGLDAVGQRTSAYDLALIARAALANPEFARLVAARELTVIGPGSALTTIRPENKLLAAYPGAIGVKTGYTVKAGGTFVGAARRGGRTIVVTLLHASPGYFPEAQRLLDWGFSVSGRPPAVGVLVPPQAEAAPNDTRALDESEQPPAATRSVQASPVLTVNWWLAGGSALALAAGLAVAAALVRRSRRRHLAAPSSAP